MSRRRKGLPARTRRRFSTAPARATLSLRLGSFRLVRRIRLFRSIAPRIEIVLEQYRGGQRVYFRLPPFGRPSLLPDRCQCASGAHALVPELEWQGSALL